MSLTTYQALLDEQNKCEDYGTEFYMTPQQRATVKKTVVLLGPSLLFNDTCAIELVMPCSQALKLVDYTRTLGLWHCIMDFNGCRVTEHTGPERDCRIVKPETGVPSNIFKLNSKFVEGTSIDDDYVSISPMDKCAPELLKVEGDFLTVVVIEDPIIHRQTLPRILFNYFTSE